MNYRPIGLIIFFIGLIFIIIGYFQLELKKSNSVPKVQYRFIPRNFEEEQINPASPLDTFDYMFYDQQPWVYSFTKEMKPPFTRDNINKYYISQY
jgi:hypothetical protein